MVSIHVIEFVVLKMLHNLVSMQKSYKSLTTADVSKITSNARCYITFISTKFSETVKIFV